MSKFFSGRDDKAPPAAHRALWDNPHEPPRARLANPLTELADRYGTDKGSLTHLYTNHYHLLFSPSRHDTFNMLELGLQIGGPEVDQPAHRETTDAPSVRMWLDYFSQCHGLWR